MSKLWDTVGHTAYTRKEHQLHVPDHRTQRLSCWTYADMKREFARSMELFAEKGFSDERVNLAYNCACLKRYFAMDKKSVAAMTENVMANTIRVIGAFETGSVKMSALSRQEYEKQISAYRSAETRGLTLSPEEYAELKYDIETALKLVQKLEYSKPVSDDDGVSVSCKFIERHFKDVKKAPPPADSDKRLRELLSNRAYEMLTEYEREEEIVDIDFLENEYLKPNGLKLTDGLREFAELYAGREYIWHAPCFLMDYPLSRCWYKGYSVDLFLTWTGRIEADNYFIPAMSEFVPPYTGPEIDGNGMIHFYGEGYWLDFPNTAKPLAPEEFFEREARERYKDGLLIERRRELENKYLIPEIRTASM